MSKSRSSLLSKRFIFFASENHHCVLTRVWPKSDFNDRSSYSAKASESVRLMCFLKAVLKWVIRYCVENVNAGQLPQRCTSASSRFESIEKSDFINNRLISANDPRRNDASIMRLKLFSLASLLGISFDARQRNTQQNEQ